MIMEKKVEATIMGYKGITAYNPFITHYGSFHFLPIIPIIGYSTEDQEVILRLEHPHGPAKRSNLSNYC